MRVAHFLLGRCNPESANGVDKTVFHLTTHLALLGARVKVFALTNKAPIPIPGVEVEHLPPPRYGRVGSKLPYISSEAVRRLLAWRPDVVHFHSVHIGPFIALSKILKQKGIPYVVTPHGALAPGRLEQVGFKVQVYIHLLEKSYLQGACFVHAVSRNDVDGLKALGVKANTVIVPNGIDLNAVPTQVDANLLHRRFPALRGKRVFIFLGRLDPIHKGLDLLLESFSQAQVSNAMLVLIGPDWRGSLASLQKQAQRLGIENRVIFTGPVFGEEKLAYLAGADVFVHPSRWEGFSFSVLEALAMGKPVLVSQAADPGDIRIYGAGVTVAPLISEIVEALRILGNFSSEKLNQMGQRGRALVEERYTWKKIAFQLLEAYKHYG